mmetsp:Transcript_45932/g.98444  ORF Transcript_45932/g.98444 Transcript_45932/m.98444 type:complete len:80 (+) Transcript_45932:326-565(+)
MHTLMLLLDPAGAAPPVAVGEPGVSAVILLGPRASCSPKKFTVVRGSSDLPPPAFSSSGNNRRSLWTANDPNAKSQVRG